MLLSKKKQTLNAIIHHQKVYPTGPSPYERSYSNLCHARTACFPSGQSHLLADSVPLQSLIRVAEKEIQQQIKTKSTKKRNQNHASIKKTQPRDFFLSNPCFHTVELLPRQSKLTHMHGISKL